MQVNEQYFGDFIAVFQDQDAGLSAVKIESCKIEILIYAYSRGMFSSREIERRCKEDLSFMYIAQMGCPDFRVLSNFRKDHTGFFYDCFKQTVKLAIELKLASLGHISLDGSKFKANSGFRGFSVRDKEKVAGEFH